jgi:hypothetical protein
MQALQRIGELADIGSVVAFLASDDACWIIATRSESMAARSWGPPF